MGLSIVTATADMLLDTPLFRRTGHVFSQLGSHGVAFLPFIIQTYQIH